MSLQEKINSDLKVALKSGQKDALITLRAINANLQNKALEKKAKGQDTTLSDEEIVSSLTSEAKKRKESISAYESAGRNELAQTEKAELEIIQKYLPEQLSEQETRAEIETLLKDQNPSDIGQAMALIMPKLKGRADAKLISQIVKERLS